jgi:hypothetical protein
MPPQRRRRPSRRRWWRQLWQRGQSRALAPIPSRSSKVGADSADAREPAPPGEVWLLEILEHAGEGDEHLVELDCRARVGIV